MQQKNAAKILHRLGKLQKLFKKAKKGHRSDLFWLLLNDLVPGQNRLKTNLCSQITQIIIFVYYQVKTCCSKLSLNFCAFSFERFPVEELMQDVLNVDVQVINFL